MTLYVCGPAEEATKASKAHYAYHTKTGTPICEKARREAAWDQAQRREGRVIVDYQPRLVNQWVCGPAEAATGPGRGHRDWHSRNGTEPCPKSIREATWSWAERREGRPLPDYQPKFTRKMGGHVCGPAEAATEGSYAHYGWHRWNGTPICGKAQHEWRWRQAEYRINAIIEDYEPFAELNWDVPTSVYMIAWEDGTRYYGITHKPVEDRVYDHSISDRPVGDKLRSGMEHKVETLCVAPNRWVAMEIETLAIRSGNPWGELLNRQHNPDYVFGK